MESPDSALPGAYPRCRTDLLISPIEVDGVEYFTVKDPKSEKYFRLRAPEVWLLERLDGETPPGELAARFNLKFDTKLTDTDIAGFVAHLARLNLTVPLQNQIATSSAIKPEESQPESQIQSRSAAQNEQPPSGYLHQAKRFNFTEIYFGTINPSTFISWLTRLYRPLHSPLGLLLALAVLVPGLWLFTFNFSSFALTFDLLSSGTSLVTLIAAMFVMISFHEFAHAVLLNHYGGTVTRMGFMFLYFQPCFYCDVSDAWRLRYPWQRILVSAAGLIAQLLILALAAIVWRLTEPGSWIGQFALATVVVSWLNFFFNFIPLIKLDGYYILTDWWGIPNLREQSFARLRRPIRRFLGLPEEPITWLPNQDRRLFWFGLASFVYSYTLLVLMIWFFGSLAGRWFGSEGVLLYSILVAGMLARAALRAGQTVASYLQAMTKGTVRSSKTIGAAIFILPLLGLFFFYPLPHTTGGEISLRALSTFEVRLTGAGLLEQEVQRGGAHPSRQTSFLQPASNDIASLTLVPKVTDGATVMIGDTLVIFASNEVTRQLSEAEAELAQLQSELALIKAPPKKERVAEAQAQIESAKADLDQKRRDLVRAESLSVRGLLPVSQLEANRTAVTMSEAALRNRESTFRLIASPPRPEEESVIVNAISKQQARLSFLRTQVEAQLITSPIAGKAIVSRDGDRVLSVHATDTLEATIPVSDIDLPLIWLDQSAQVKVRSHADTVFRGTVIRVPVMAQSDSLNGSFEVAVILPNEAGLLREGMEGYGKISVGEISAAGLLWRKLMSVTRVEFWGLW